MLLAKLEAEHPKQDKLTPRRKHRLFLLRTQLFWVMMNSKESRECVLKPVKLKTTTPWERPREKISKVFQMPEFLNGQTLFKPKDKEKKRRESKSLKTMKSKEEKSTPKKRVTNKNWDKPNSTRLTSNSMTTKIWLRLFIAKCFYAMSPLSNKLREN